jgi:hypothetical protein
MRKRIFAAIIVLSAVFTMILWQREQSHKKHLEFVKMKVRKMENTVNLLNLEAMTLKMELEMLRISVNVFFTRNLASVNKIGGKKNDKMYH